MSREYMVLLVEPLEVCPGVATVEGAQAEVFMRFTEEPDSDFLHRLAGENPGKRVYCLLGASTWHSSAGTP